MCAVFHAQYAAHIDIVLGDDIIVAREFTTPVHCFLGGGLVTVWTFSMIFSQKPSLNLLCIPYSFE